MQIALLYVLAYLVGSFPTAYVLGRVVKGIDIRDYGSGNVGGSNVFYHVGKAWVVPLGAIEVFIKGAGPFWVGHYLIGLGWDSYVLAGAGLMAVAGHNWSVWLKFTGGRGVAVAIGGMYGFCHWVLALFAGIAFFSWLKFRSSGVVVYLSLLLTPLWAWLFHTPAAVLYTFGVIGLVTVKRLLSNFTPPPKDQPLYQVVINRLFRDRDIVSHDDWVHKRPEETAKKG